MLPPGGNGNDAAQPRYLPGRFMYPLTTVEILIAAVPNLTKKIIPPGPHSAVARQGQRMIATGCDCCYSRQTCNFNGCCSVDSRAVTQFTELVLAPGPDSAIGFYRKSIAIAG